MEKDAQLPAPPYPGPPLEVYQAQPGTRWKPSSLFFYPFTTAAAFAFFLLIFFASVVVFVLMVVSRGRRHASAQSPVSGGVFLGSAIWKWPWSRWRRGSFVCAHFWNGQRIKKQQEMQHEVKPQSGGFRKDKTKKIWWAISYYTQSILYTNPESYQ